MLSFAHPFPSIYCVSESFGSDLDLNPRLYFLPVYTPSGLPCTHFAITVQKHNSTQWWMCGSASTSTAAMVVNSPWLCLVSMLSVSLSLTHTHTQLIQCQCTQAKPWLWGSLWQDSIGFGPNGATVWPNNTGSLTSGSVSRLMPCGFALIDESNHTLCTFQCSPVTETNPVSPNRYYHFTLKTTQHLIKPGCSDPVAK